MTSEEARKLLTATWRQGTNKNYDLAWKAGVRKDMSATSSSLNDIFSFLASQFHKGYSYRSLNFYRSAISLIHDKIDGVEVGLVSRLLKGVFNKKPPLPKYSETWPVEKVLGCLKSLGLNLSLSLQQHTQKLAVLLALTTASRSSDLALIDVNFCHFVPGGIRCTLGGLTKQLDPSIEGPHWKWEVSRILCFA